MSDARSSSSDQYVRPQSGDAWAADAARQGKVGTQRLIAVETLEPPAEVADGLGLKEGEQVVVRRRLILADEQPVEIAESYYPASIAAGTALAEPRKIRGGAVRLLDEAGHLLDESVDRITAEMPTAEQAALLDIAQTEPLIVIRRVSVNDNAGPVEYAINAMVSSRVEPLAYRMRNTVR